MTAASSMAFVNARSVNEITLNGWTMSDDEDVRMIGALELVRRHIARDVRIERVELAENTGYQDGPALYVKSNGKEAKVEYTGDAFFIWTAGDLWTTVPEEQAASIPAEIVLATAD